MGLHWVLSLYVMAAVGVGGLLIGRKCFSGSLPVLETFSLLLRFLVYCLLSCPVWLSSLGGQLISEEEKEGK